jgi:ribosome assembly protein YihI (activator of Der GTPase)
MLYNLIKTCRGKETVVMTDSRKNVNSRLKTLRKSHRGQHSGMRGPQKISFRVEESGGNVKYKKKPHNPKISGDRDIPRVK